MVRWVTLEQLGFEGKEGVTHLAKNPKTGEEVAIKKFKKGKTTGKIKKEARYQNLAYEAGIAPEVYNVNLKRRQIVMEKMDRTLLEVVYFQGGKLTSKQQRRIFELYREIYIIGLQHNDSSPLNIMEKDGELYFIDFGYTTKTKEDEPDYYSIKHIFMDKDKGLITKGIMTKRPKILEKLFLDAVGEYMIAPLKKKEKKVGPMSPKPIKHVTNPETGKRIKVGGKVYRKLKAKGVI
jgi:RIO-like serine/threonine protein kinase